MPANTVGLNRRAYRAKRKIQVLRGFSPTEPNKLSSLAEPDNDPTLIQEGMALVIAANGTFRATEAGDATTATRVFIALQDGNAHDVIAAGKLVGLDCSDTYEVETGYYDPAGVYTPGVLLTVAAGGLFTVADGASELIVGVVTANEYTPDLISPEAEAGADNAVIRFTTRLTGVKTAP
jgi:hypothetical protein